MKNNEIFASLVLNKNNIDTLMDRATKAINSGVSGLSITEEYESDSEHEANLFKLTDLARSISVPVYARLRKDAHEDVKKYLYAGCKGVIIDENLSNILKESADRFLDTKESSIDSVEAPVSNIKFSDLKTNSDGLVPCIVQDYKDGCVLMMAYMNEESFNLTLKNRQMTYFSRSRNKLWLKGEESGHFQRVISLTTDCDCDTLLAKVEQTGVACHTGRRSCFFNDIIGTNDFSKDSDNVLDQVYEIIMDRKNNPKEGSYTNYLFDKGVDKILKKVGEETTEIVIAAKNPENKEIVYEISDLLYHLSVLMAAKDVTWDEIMEELKNR